MRKIRKTIRFSKLVSDAEIRNKTPQREDEESVFGHMPDVESDDSTMENEHLLGLRLNEDSEHPKPLNMEEDLKRLELYKKTH